jgi:hypothetical protein
MAEQYATEILAAKILSANGVLLINTADFNSITLGPFPIPQPFSPPHIILQRPV